MADELEGDGKSEISLQKDRRSYNGLNVAAGVIYEECNSDLRWPQCIETYNAMMKDATIAPTLNLLDMYMSKVEWSVVAPEGYEGELSEKVDFLYQVMEDMEHSWRELILNASSINRYGFAPVEKVYRRRNKSKGSKFNDGRWGIKSLPLISQSSVKSWEWNNSGRDLTGLWQQVNIPSKDYKSSEIDEIFIPRKKFILFRTNPYKDNPVGQSPLNSVYVAWRFKGELEKNEATSIANDVRGLKVIKVPPRYLDKDASADDKATAEYFKDILRGLHNGEQSGVLLPLIYDDNGKPMFDFEVISVMGQVAHQVSDVIKRYQSEIVTGLLNPLLLLGQDGSGSFALSQSLGSITDTVVESRLKEVRDQLNHDLVKQLFLLNGWDTTVMPRFEFTRVQSSSVDELGKYIQRVAAAGMLKSDAKTANWVAEQVGMPVPFGNLDVSVDEVREQMTKFTSNAGEGMVEAAGQGTGKSLSMDDNSVSNLEN